MKTSTFTFITILSCLTSTGNLLQSQTASIQSFFKPEDKYWQLHQTGPASSYDRLINPLHRHLKEWITEERSRMSGTNKKEFSEKSELTTFTNKLISEQALMNTELHFRGAGSRLDSTYRYDYYFHESLPVEKIFFGYDASGRKQEEVHRFFFLPWEKDRKSTYVYNDDGKLTHELNQQWADLWIDYQRKSYTCDASNRVLETVTEEYQPWENNWREVSKIEYTYNGAFDQADTIKYFNNFGSWALRDLEVFELNGQGKPVKKRFFYKEWNSNDLFEHRREVYLYDQEQILMERLSQFLCNNVPGMWFDMQREVLSYNPDGAIEKTSYFFPNNNYEPSWQLAGQSVYSYDEDGNLVAENHQILRLGGDFVWKERLRNHLEYGSNGKIAKVVVENRDDALDNWFQFDVTEFSYNNLGLLEEEVQKSKACFQTIQPRYKYSKAYNASMQLVEDNYHDWNFATGTWADANFRTTFEYNGMGQLQTEYYETKPLNSPAWEVAHRTTHTYNSDGTIGQSILQFPVGFGDQWYNGERKVYTYNGSGLLTELLTQSWFQPLNLWDDVIKIVFTYNDAGLLMESTESYKGFTGEWLYAAKRNFSYNGQGQIVEEWVSYWNPDNETWLWNQRYTTVYNPLSGNPETVLTEYYEGSEMVLNTYGVNQHFWSGEPTATISPEAQMLECRLSNPYKMGSPITCESLTNGNPGHLALYDMLGRLRVQKTFNGATELDGKMAPGCYLLMVQSENGETFRQKIIVK